MRNTELQNLRNLADKHSLDYESEIDPELDYYENKEHFLEVAGVSGGMGGRFSGMGRADFKEPSASEYREISGQMRSYLEDMASSMKVALVPLARLKRLERFEHMSLRTPSKIRGTTRRPLVEKLIGKRPSLPKRTPRASAPRKKRLRTRTGRTGKVPRALRTRTLQGQTVFSHSSKTWGEKLLGKRKRRRRR